MKAMVLLALTLLPLVAQADVIIPENERQHRPPMKTDTTVTASTTATTTTTAGTTAAATTTTIAETAATQTTGTQAAPAPETRRSTFPFAALFTIGIVVIAVSARRRRERKAQ